MVLGLSLFTLALATWSFFPLAGLLAVAVAAALVVGIREPGWILLLYTASLFLFQVPLLKGTLAVPTVAGTLLILVVCLRRSVSTPVARPGFSGVQAILPFFLAIVLSATFNFEWLAANPRGLITYLALCATVLASAHVLQDRQWFWKISWVFSAGVAVCSVLTVYESLTGQFNAVGLFEGSDERAYGLADPNYTAALLVTLLPFVIALLVRAKSLIARVFFLLQIALAYTAIGMTASRGGFLGAMITTVFAIAWIPCKQAGGAYRGRSPAPASKWLTQRVALIGVLVLGVTVAVAAAPTKLWERLSTLENWSRPDKVVESRTPIWEYYLNRWRQSPVWGFGPGYVDPAVEQGRQDIPHNTPLQVLVELGICGATGFLLLNGAALWQALKARKQFSRCGERGFSIISGATATALVGFHSTAFFLTSATHKELWLLLGLATALYYASKRVQTVSQISDGLDGGHS